MSHVHLFEWKTQKHLISFKFSIQTEERVTPFVSQKQHNISFQERIGTGWSNL